MSLAFPSAWAPPVAAARVAVGLILAHAATGKLRDPAVFRGVVHAYRLLPDRLADALAAVLPPVEAGLAALLIAGVLAPFPGLVAAPLLVVFAGAIGINVARGRTEIDCGCFRGAAPQRIGWGLVGRNLGLAALALLAAVPVRGDLAAFAQGVGAGVSLFLVFLTINTLPRARRRARA
ncbi:MAG TPA: MauE/DoxX family redox-associated membrane protein [Acetobacteraceae bacterium]|nr:MauE/DoxX family redox-associated membrane protein [Acetobacteraceae bacterium]